MSKGKSNSNMSTVAASRIQSSAAKSNGGKVLSGSFAARAQTAAAINASPPKK